MVTSAKESWAEHALATLTEAGLRRGVARTAVIEALDSHECAVSALELADELRLGKPKVARASIYRALEQLEELGLIQRIEINRGTAAYERVETDGHHHHHAICRSCGRMVTFEDMGLERAIGRISAEVPFEVSEHDVVLRGLCETCVN